MITFDPSVHIGLAFATNAISIGIVEYVSEKFTKVPLFQTTDLFDRPVRALKIDLCYRKQFVYPIFSIYQRGLHTHQLPANVTCFVLHLSRYRSLYHRPFDLSDFSALPYSQASI